MAVFIGYKQYPADLVWDAQGVLFHKLQVYCINKLQQERIIAQIQLTNHNWKFVEYDITCNSIHREAFLEVLSHFIPDENQAKLEFPEAFEPLKEIFYSA